MKSPMQKRREKLKLSRKAMAGLIGVSESTLTKWERGERKPSLESYKKLSAFLGVGPLELDIEHGKWRKLK